MRGWHFKEIPDEDIVRGEHLKKKSRLKILPLTRVRGFLFVKEVVTADLKNISKHIV